MKRQDGGPGDGAGSRSTHQARAAVELRFHSARIADRGSRTRRAVRSWAAAAADEDFAFIYRAAMEGSWEPLSRSLFYPVPRESTEASRFSPILRGEKLPQECWLAGSRNIVRITSRLGDQRQA
jgi:hypothetical protein